MPQQLVQKNGQWVLQGADSEADATPYQSLNRPDDRAKSQPVAAKPKPQAKPKPKGFFGQLLNDIQYEANQLRSNPTRSAQRLQNTLNQGRDAVGKVMWQASPYNAVRQAALGTAGVTDNAVRLIEAGLARPSGKKGGDSGMSRVADQYTDLVYQVLGAKPPSQMNAQERGIDQWRRTITSTAMTSVPLGAAGVLGKLPLIGKATTGVGAAVRGGVGFVAGELPQTLLEDQRSGNIPSALNEAFGWKLPGAVDPGRDDYLDAALKSAPYDMGAAALFGGVMGVGVDVAKRFPASARWLRESRQVAEVQSARSQLETAGVTRAAEDGTTTFSPDVTPTPEPVAATPAAAPTPQAQPAAGTAQKADPRQAVEQWINDGADPAAAAPTPEVMPSPEAIDAPPAVQVPDPLDYDPELPEADTVLRGVKQLDDQQLKDAVAGNQPVTELVDEALGNAPEPQADPRFYDRNWELVTAPRESLSADAVDGYRSSMEGMPLDQLRSIAHPDNSPELFSRIQGLTGREWQDFTRGDIVDGLDAMAASGERLVVPRDLGQRLTPVADLQIDPQRFQFKQGVDAQGQQKGNSLTGVDKWNPRLEGSLQTWTDPDDGLTYVVNGHNRLAKAKELGIQSVPTQELIAATAEEARAAGALANIASGGGTVFDAAKFFKDGGITGLETLKAMGAPLRSGLARDGLALSKLPDNIFQDALDGVLPQGKAVALGNAGLSEEAMQQAYKALQGRDLTDATWGEVLQQARSAPEIQGSQVDLFGNTETLNLMVEKGNLAARIRREISSDKNLFGRTAKNAKRLKKGGNQIDQATSKEIAAKAEALLGTFDAEKYATGPISDLLNEGAAQIAGGAKVGVVVDRIKAQLVAAAESFKPDRMAAIRKQLLDDGTYRDGALLLEADAFLNKPGRELNAQVTVEGVEAMPADWLQAQGIGSVGNLSTQRKINLLRQYTFEKLREMPEGVYALDGIDEARERIYERWFAGGEVPGVRRADDPLLSTRFEYRPQEDPGSEAYFQKMEATYGDMPADRLSAVRQEAEQALLTELKRGRRQALAEKLRQQEGAALEASELSAEDFAQRYPAAQAFLDQEEAIKAELLADPALAEQWQSGPRSQWKKGRPVHTRLNKAGEVELARRTAELGTYPGPVIPTKAEYKVFDELKADEWAQGFIRWHDRQPRARAIAQTPASADGLTTQNAASLDDRAALARQQLEQARASGDEAGAAAWEQEMRQLERSRIANAQDAMGTSQQDMFGVGAYDTSTPLLNQPATPAAPTIEIPAGASRKITARTADARIQSAAESLMDWTTPPGGDALLTLDQALELVKAKGAILDPDKIPGLDMAAAREAGARRTGSTPEMEAVAAAYRQFYGVAAPAPQRAAQPQGIQIKEASPLADEGLGDGGPEYWATQEQQWRDTKAAKARDELLTARAVARREELEATLPVDAPRTVELQELDRHRQAEEYLAWYDEQQALEPLGPEARLALENELLTRAARNGEVRPPTTPIPELMDGPAADLHQAGMDLEEGLLAPGSPAAQATADEFRLSRQLAERDAQMDWAQEVSFRETVDWDQLPFEQRQAMTLAAEFDAPPPKRAGEELAQQLADTYDEAQIQQFQAAGPVTPEELQLTLTPQVGDALDRWFGEESGLQPAMADGLLSPQEMADTAAAIRQRLEVDPPAAAVAKALAGVADQLDGLAGRSRYWQLEGQLTPTPMTLTTPPPSPSAQFAERLLERTAGDPALRGALQQLGPDVEAGVMRQIQKLGTNPTEGAIDAVHGELKRLAQRSEPLAKAMGEIHAQLRVAAGDLKAVNFSLPEELAAKPVRITKARITFQSPLDQAAAVLAGADGPAKQQMGEAVLRAGLPLEELMAHGKQVRAAAEAAVRDPAVGKPGGGLALSDQGFVSSGKPSAALEEFASSGLARSQAAIDQLTTQAKKGGCI